MRGNAWRGKREAAQPTGGNMPEYLFDGRKLKKRSGRREGELDGNAIKSWNGEQLGEIDGNSIKDSSGKKVLDFDGKYIRDEAGKRIASLEDIRKIVEGQAGISMVAMWYFFIWK